MPCIEFLSEPVSITLIVRRVVLKIQGSSNLQLIKGGAQRVGWRLTQAPGTKSLKEVVLSLISSRETGRIDSEAVDSLIQALQEVRCPQTIVQDSLDVSILILNSQGDASICFKYVISNFGMKSLDARPHRYWFSEAQEDIKFYASTEDGLPLEIEDVETTAHFKRLKINFPKPLEPAERVSYRVQYICKGEFYTDQILNSQYYSIATGNPTKKLSFTAVLAPGQRINQTRVSLESADGFISDGPPVPKVTEENGRDRIYWEFRSAKSGDQFRSDWSIQKNLNIPTGSL